MDKEEFKNEENFIIDDRIKDILESDITKNKKIDRIRLYIKFNSIESKIQAYSMSNFYIKKRGLDYLKKTEKSLKEERDKIKNFWRDNYEDNK